jgi:hypothetical protein
MRVVREIMPRHPNQLEHVNIEIKLSGNIQQLPPTSQKRLPRSVSHDKHRIHRLVTMAEKEPALTLQ